MAGSSWPSLVAGQIARASDVESKFDWLEGSLVPMSNGSTTDSVHDIGTTTAYWRTIYTRSIAGTSTAKTVVVGTTAACTTTADSCASVEFAGNRSIILPRISTANIANLTAVDGMLVYNTTTSQLQLRKNGAWVNIGGTVYQAKAVAKGSTTAGTTTVLNVTGGGGRIHGIFGFGSPSIRSRIEVQLDSITVAAFSSPASHAGDCAIVPNGAGFWQANDFGGAGIIVQSAGPAVQFPATSTGNSVTAYANAFGGGLNWDFASTATVYISSIGGGTTSCWVLYSIIA